MRKSVRETATVLLARVRGLQTEFRVVDSQTEFRNQKKRGVAVNFCDSFSLAVGDLPDGKLRPIFFFGAPRAFELRARNPDKWFIVADSMGRSGEPSRTGLPLRSRQLRNQRGAINH